MNDEQHGRSRTGVAVGLHQICESVSREKRFLVAEEAPGVERRESLYEAPCGRGRRSVCFLRWGRKVADHEYGRVKLCMSGSDE